MAWNGNGSTVAEKAVFGSRSFAHPSTLSRKSRVQPGGSGGSAPPRNRSRNSSPEPMITRRSSISVERVPARHHIAYKARAWDSRRMTAKPVVEECVGLFALRIDTRCGEAAELKIRRGQRDDRLRAPPPPMPSPKRPRPSRRKGWSRCEACGWRRGNADRPQ